MADKKFQACGVCERSIDESELGVCSDCRSNGPPTWSECRGPVDFQYRTMTYRDATELTTAAEKLIAVRAIRHELLQSALALKKMRQARYRLPDDIDDLTASRLTTILSSLPSESWKKSRTK